MPYEGSSIRFELFRDHTYTPNSADNIFQYDHVYIDSQADYFTNKFGMKSYVDDMLKASAVILNVAGATSVHPDSYVVTKECVHICVGNSVYCLSLPDLELVWNVKCDDFTCFGIYELKSDFIIHGELNITRINKNGEIVWKKSGSDIFVTPDDKNAFFIKDGIISAKSWDGREYKIDFNGNSI